MTNRKAEKNKRSLLKADQVSADEQPISLTENELYELAHILDTVLEHGGMFSVFTSRDQQAFCLQVKFGKDQFRSWQAVKDPRLTAVHEFWGRFQGADRPYKIAPRDDVS